MNLQEVNDEIVNDPAALGYAGKTRIQQASRLNNPDIGQQYKELIRPTYILHSRIIDLAEWDAMDPAMALKFGEYLKMLPNDIDIASVNVQTALMRYFGFESQTVANCAAECACSRAERLWGQEVTSHQIEQSFGEA